jgi:RNA polymerase sigma-70 factor (ECF subfamily)
MTDDEFSQAFDQHKDAVYRFAWRMAGPDSADDIAQDVFLALLRHPERFDPARGSLRTFLLAIARNLALKRHRQEHRLQPLDADDVIVAPVDPALGEIGELVGAAVRALPPLQREVIILAEFEELALGEIAVVVDAEIGAVKARLHRARQNLRRALQPLARGSHCRVLSEK